MSGSQNKGVEQQKNGTWGIIVKGIILSGWIMGLLFTALLAANSQVSQWTFHTLELRGHTYRMFDQTVTDATQTNPALSNDSQQTSITASANNDAPISVVKTIVMHKQPLAIIELKRFLANIPTNSEHPPIELILDHLIMVPNWSERILTKPNQIVMNTQDWQAAQYHKLFTNVYEELQSVTVNTAIDPTSYQLIFKELVPSAFYLPDKQELENKITFPAGVSAWIQLERAQFQSNKLKRNLTDTFVLMLVLGAFGSLIFLTKDFIFSAVKQPLESYFFRPVLGMFLAVAIFIVDISLHALTSSSGLADVRNDTLYLLGLAAGLLSEKVYAVISDTLAKKVNDFTENEPDESHNGHHPSAT